MQLGVGCAFGWLEAEAVAAAGATETEVVAGARVAAKAEVVAGSATLGGSLAFSRCRASGGAAGGDGHALQVCLDGVLDKNGDGCLTQEEWDSFMQGHGAMKAQQGAAAPGSCPVKPGAMPMVTPPAGK